MKFSRNVELIWCEKKPIFSNRQQNINFDAVHGSSTYLFWLNVKAVQFISIFMNSVKCNDVGRSDGILWWKSEEFQANFSFKPISREKRFSKHRPSSFKLQSSPCQTFLTKKMRREQIFRYERVKRGIPKRNFRKVTSLTSE